jgi:folylpolyglutamate synthase/dihydropteroate synthase
MINREKEAVFKKENQNNPYNISFPKIFWEYIGGDEAVVKVVEVLNDKPKYQLFNYLDPIDEYVFVMDIEFDDKKSEKEFLSLFDFDDENVKKVKNRIKEYFFK